MIYATVSEPDTDETNLGNCAMYSKGIRGKAFSASLANDNASIGLLPMRSTNSPNTPTSPLSFRRIQKPHESKKAVLGRVQKESRQNQRIGFSVAVMPMEALIALQMAASEACSMRCPRSCPSP